LIAIAMITPSALLGKRFNYEYNVYMKVTKEKAALNRRALVRAASKLFRRHGIDGIGVAEIGREAGLTHGALYAQFDSKQTLAAAALADALDRSYDQMMVLAEGDVSPMGTYLDFYINKPHRDDISKGCAMTASGSEIARQGKSVSRAFTDGFGRFARTLEGALDNDTPLRSTPRQRALTIAAGCIGAIVAARAVAKADPILSDDIIAAARRVLGEVGGD
jgi:TetR/AcrR family transcriptional regulator, transcriptional repressor for nem operon